jgi:hypothetical protein
MWNAVSMEAIGNSLGSFVSLDETNLLTPSRKMGKILVEMDVHGGLPELLEIDWRGCRIVQRLDYLGIPFRCSICHKTGHLRNTCMGREEEEISEDTTLHRDLGDLEDEVASIGVDYCVPPLESTPSPERDDTFMGKLSFYCPTLYNTYL